MGEAGVHRVGDQLRRHPAVFVVLASMAFATAGPLARYARPVHPLLLAWGRVALAAVILFAIDPRGVLHAFASLRGRQRVAVAGVGGLLAAHFAAFLWGLDLTSLPAAIALVSLEPLSVVLCAWAIHGIRPTRPEQIGVVAATVGAVVVATGAGIGDHRLAGDLLVLVAVVLYGFYISAARSLAEALPVRAYATLVYASAAVVLGVAVSSVGASSVIASLPPHAVVAIALLAVVPTVLGHTAVQTGARHLSPAVVALVSPGETLGGIAIGAALLGAVPSARELVGALIIVAGASVAIVGASVGDAGATEGVGR